MRAPSAVAVVPVMTGAAVDTPPVVPDPVITTPADELLPVPVAEAAVSDPVFDAVEPVVAVLPPPVTVAEEILGRSADDDLDWAEAMVRRERAKRDVRSGDFRASLIVNVGLKEMLVC